MSLTKIVSSEFEKMLVQCGRTYTSLLWYTKNVEPSKRAALEREVSKSSEKVKTSALTFLTLIEGGELDFSPSSVELLKKAYHSLERGFPNHESVASISQAIIDSFDNTKIARYYKNIKQFLPIQSAIAIGSGAVALTLENNVAAALYLTAAGTSVFASNSGKDQTFSTIWANMGIWLGAIALTLLSEATPGSNEAKIQFGTYLLHFPAAVGLVRTALYLIEKTGYNSKVHSIQRARIDLDLIFDNFKISSR